MLDIAEAKRTLGLENVSTVSISKGVLALAYEYQRSVAAANNDEAAVNEVCKARATIESYCDGGYFPPTKRQASNKTQATQGKYSAAGLEFASSSGIAAGLKTALATREWVAMIIMLVCMLPTLSAGVLGLVYLISFLCIKVIFLDCIYLPYRFKRRVWAYITSESMDSLPKVQDEGRFIALGGNHAFDRGSVLQLLAPWKRGIVLGLAGIGLAMLFECVTSMRIMEAVEVGIIVAIIVFLTRNARFNVDWNDALERAMISVGGIQREDVGNASSAASQTSAHGSQSTVEDGEALHLPMGARPLTRPLFPVALSELSAGRLQMAAQVLASIVAGPREVVPVYRSVRGGFAAMFGAACAEFSTPGASTALVAADPSQSVQAGQGASMVQPPSAYPATGDARGLLCSALGIEQGSSNTFIESEFFRKAGLSHAGSVFEKLQKGATVFEQSFQSIDQATRNQLHSGDATAVMSAVLRYASSSGAAFDGAAPFLCWLVYAEFGKAFRDSCNRQWLFSAIAGEHALPEAVFTMGEQAKSALERGLANLEDLKIAGQALRSDEGLLNERNHTLEDARKYSDAAMFESESTRLRSDILVEEGRARTARETASMHEGPLREAERLLHDTERQMDEELDRLADVIDGYVDDYNDIDGEIENLENYLDETRNEIEEMEEWVSSGSYVEEDAARNDISDLRDEIAYADEELESKLAEIDARYGDLDPNNYNGFQNIGRENRAGSQRYRAHNEHDLKVSTAQRKIDKLDTELSEISSKRVSWEAEARRLRSEVSGAQMELDNLYGRLDSAQRQIDRSQSEYDRAEARYEPLISEQKARCNSLSGEIASARKSASDHSKEANRLQGRLDTITKYFEGGADLIADYEDKISQIESKIADRKVKIASLEQLNRELHAEFLQAFAEDVEGYEEKAEEFRQAIGAHLAKDVFGEPLEFFSTADSVTLLSQSPRFFANLHESLYRELIDSPQGAQIKASIRRMQLPFDSVAGECRNGGFASVFSNERTGELNDACTWLVEQAEGSGELPLKVAGSAERTLLLQKSQSGWALQFA